MLEVSEVRCCHGAAWGWLEMAGEELQKAGVNLHPEADSRKCLRALDNPHQQQGWVELTGIRHWKTETEYNENTSSNRIRE